MKDALVKSLSALLESPNDVWCEAAKNGEVYKSELLTLTLHPSAQP